MGVPARGWPIAGPGRGGERTGDLSSPQVYTYYFSPKVLPLLPTYKAGGGRLSVSRRAAGVYSERCTPRAVYMRRATSVQVKETSPWKRPWPLSINTRWDDVGSLG